MHTSISQTVPVQSKAAPYLRALGVVMALSCWALPACSDSQDKSSTAGSAGVTSAPSPCLDELKCGADCGADEDCPSGQFCDSNACYAECTPSGGECLGTCMADGRCDGELARVVAVPQSSDANGGVFFGDESSGSGAGSGDVIACATGSATAMLRPVSMFMMFDRSLSMADDNKWPSATNALISFLEDASTADLSIALRFFGDNSPVAGCNDTECSLDACSVPLVDIGTLAASAGDPQEVALVSAIEQAVPDFRGTPLSAALGGALQWAEDYQADHQDQQTVVVLVTDGEPRGCDTDIDSIASLAAASRAAQGILTYAVGLEGSNVQQMDRIAEEGGTGAGYFIGNGNAEQDLANALADIRGRSLSCEFPVPMPSDGQTIDQDEINVIFSSSETGTISFGAVSEGACASERAWYYDNEEDPSSILLCDAACELALEQPDGALEVVIGCATGSLPPVIAK